MLSHLCAHAQPTIPMPWYTEWKPLMCLSIILIRTGCLWSASVMKFTNATTWLKSYWNFNFGSVCSAFCLLCVMKLSAEHQPKKITHTHTRIVINSISSVFVRKCVEHRNFPLFCRHWDFAKLLRAIFLHSPNNYSLICNCCRYMCARINEVSCFQVLSFFFSLVHRIRFHK